jgi:phospholipid/cholesterol/gamma-HCH transport system permease protein
MTAIFHYLGDNFLRFLVYLGELAELISETTGSILRGRIRWNLTLWQILEVGYRSQLVVIITGAFTGAVLSAQIFFQFKSLGMESAIGPVVTLALLRELGPVLTGLMIAGRVGAAMSAEIGTMNVTQQIDALRALAVHPVDYLIVPRTLAMMISMPLLIAECAFFGIFAGYFTAVRFLGVSGSYYINNLLKFTNLEDLFMAVFKGVVFGILIVFISCHQGLNAKGGAVGVGRGTTEAVVISSLAILIINFFLTMLLNIVFPAGQHG